MTEPTDTPTTPEERSQAVVDAFSDAGGELYPDPNGVSITGVTTVTTEYGSGVEVAVQGRPADDPVVVVNPPMLLPDPEGDIEINGTMFRNDPLAALAFAIKLHGGA